MNHHYCRMDIFRIVFVFGVLLPFAAHSYADGLVSSSSPVPSAPYVPPSGPSETFELIYSGANISGDAFLTATSNGSGVFTVTSISGTQTLGGVTQTITGLIGPNGSPYSTNVLQTYTSSTICGSLGAAAPCSEVDLYDDLISATGAPLDFYGLLFTVSGESNPVNLCGADGCSDGATVNGESTYTSGQPGYGTNYDINTITLNAVPEPSALLLLVLGGAVVILFAGRKSRLA